MKLEPRTTSHGPRFLKNDWRKTAFALLTWCMVLGAWSVGAYGANYDIKQMTPEIQQALEGRQNRYAELQAAKRAGAIQENSQGLVSGNSGLVSAENRDRMVIYRAIAEQNNLGAAGLDQIQRAFAETIRERESR